MNDTASSDVPDPSNLLAATPVEARYRALLRATSDLIFWTDAECLLVGYHANVPEELALPPEAFLGRRVDEVLPAPAGETWKEALRRARESGCLQQFEYSLTFGDGERRYEARAFPSETGEVVTLVRNITARWKLAESLRQSEERYRTVVENQVELVSRFRPDSVLTFVNDAYCRYFHRSQDELIGMSFFEMIPEWVQGSARQSLADFIKDPGPVAWENEVFSGAGEVRWQQWNLAPILDGHGNVVEIQGVGHDCTDRRRAELELKRREVEFETLADNALDIITRHDAQMRYLYVNRALCESAQVSRERFLGKTPRELGFSESAVDPFEEALKEVFSTRQFTSALISSPGRGERSGKDVYFHVHAVPEFSESGELISVLSIARDVTALRQAQKEVEEINRSLENRVQERTEELTALNQELSQALRMKDEFLASMSHELRTPLNAILGFTQAIRDQVYGQASDRLLNAARIADAGGHHLLELINDILDLSKIQAGRLKLSLGLIPVRSLCEASLQMVEKAAQRKKLLLDLNVAPDAGVLVADGRRLKQMLVNLLSNAVEFTPEGGGIGLSVAGDREGRVIRFTVSDTGIGIAMDQIPRLFQPFTQVDSKLSRPHSGTGLGLSLVLNMAALHGGGVEVKSEIGQGSSFTILLPWAEKQIVDMSPSRDLGAQAAIFHASQRGATERSTQDKPIRLLLAEDNEGNALFLTDLLTAKGYAVSLAKNGFEAVQLARGLKPDLVLMDIQMPGMDGLEAIRRIRTAEDTKHLPILALTALAMPGDRERCLSAGANGYVTKPLDFTILLETTRNLLGQ